jgi:CheY-like chemotaxis protein
LKVLIADDDMLIRTMLSDILLELGHSVVEAKNGVEAVETYGRENPDAVFLDFLMPKMSGLDALRAIRAKGGKAPVVLLTAISDSSVRSLEPAEAPNVYLEKPLSRRAVEKALAKVRPG